MKKKQKDKQKEASEEALQEKTENAKEIYEKESIQEAEECKKDGQEVVSFDEYKKLEDEKSNLKDQLLRLAAEFDNYKKRAKKEIDDIRNYGNENIIRSLIPVMDDVERFFGTVTGEDLKDEKVLKIFSGVKMTLDTLEKKLKESGLEKHSLLGKPFDPHYGDAVMQQESSEYADGVVMNEFESAYSLNGRVIRHAKVIVAKNESQK